MATLEGLDAKMDAVYNLTEANGDKLDKVNGTVREHGNRLTAVEGFMPRDGSRLITTVDCDKARARKFDRYVALFGPLIAVLVAWYLARGG